MESGNAVATTISSSENGRALKYLKQREKEKEERDKKKAAEEAKSKKRQFTSIDNKYGSSHADGLEAQFATEIIGLVSAKEWKEKRAKIDEQIRSGQSAEQEVQEKTKIKSRVKKSTLSFGDDISDSDDDSDSDAASDKKNKDAAPAKPKKFVRFVF